MTDMTDDVEVLRAAAVILQKRDRLGCAGIAAEEADCIAAERARAADPAAQVVEALRDALEGLRDVRMETEKRHRLMARASVALAAYDVAQREAGR